MITKRIIPCLDVRNGRVVKGTNFEGIRDVADPVEMARHLPIIQSCWMRKSKCVHRRHVWRYINDLSQRYYILILS